MFILAVKRKKKLNGCYFPKDRSQISDIGGALELWQGIYQYSDNR